MTLNSRPFFILIAFLGLFPRGLFPQPSATETIETPGDRVVATGERMCFSNREIIVGSCWDFVDAVYARAGFPEGERFALFVRKPDGPYAVDALLVRGDWMMFYNHEYGEVPHSAIFIRWVDRAKTLARTLEYVGMRRARPGGYGDHVVTQIFTILRPKAKAGAAPRARP